MRLLFKQRLFSWLDSYDVFDEEGNTVYTVKGQVSFGHCLKIYDNNGNEVGMVKEKVFTWLPKFQIYYRNHLIGSINKEFSFFRPRFNIDFNGWHIEGDWFQWEYNIVNTLGSTVATISKEIFKLTDTYVIDVLNENDALYALMLVIAIDAEKCSRNKN
jgi:uncharacterized protein YxjI